MRFTPKAWRTAGLRDTVNSTRSATSANDLDNPGLSSLVSDRALWGSDHQAVKSAICVFHYVMRLESGVEEQWNVKPG